MKLFVQICRNCGKRVHLNINAETRSELRRLVKGDRFNLVCQHCGTKHIYSANEVKAELDSGGAIAGGIVGGIVGILGGPIGMLIGGAIGASIGDSSEAEERKKVEFFNNSI